LGRASPFVVKLTNADRDELEARLRRHRAEHRDVRRAAIVLMAADGVENATIADVLGVAPNTVLKWRKRFFYEGLVGLTDRPRPGRPKVFGLQVLAQVKAIACELPAKRDAPLSRWSASEIATQVVAEGVVDSISASTVSRWLAADALRPWRYCSWIFPRDPDFAAKAGVVLDLYEGIFEGRPLGPGEFVISADEKTSIQARCRCHPSLAPARARLMRVEHEYDREGALAYLGAWDVRRGRLMGRSEPTTGIEPFGRLVDQVMSGFP
jgi:transposase